MSNLINFKLIDEYLEAHDLSMTEFCKICKISRETFKKIKNDNSHFGIKALFKIARVLDIEVCELFRM